MARRTDEEVSGRVEDEIVVVRVDGRLMRLGSGGNSKSICDSSGRGDSTMLVAERRPLGLNDA